MSPATNRLFAWAVVVFWAVVAIWLAVTLFQIHWMIVVVPAGAIVAGWSLTWALSKIESRLDE